MASDGGNFLPATAACEATSVPQKEGWMIANLCPQCAQAKQHGAGEGWCNSLQCAFLRGYDIMGAIVSILTTWCAFQLENDKNDHDEFGFMAHLLPLYDQAEKTAAGLLWQMSGMIRWVLLSLSFFYLISFLSCC